MKTEFLPFELFSLPKLIQAKARQIEVSLTAQNCPTGVTIEEFISLSVFKAMQIIEREKKVAEENSKK